MNNKVVVRQCEKYEQEEINRLIPEIYRRAEGPSVRGKKVLVKPNILSDRIPGKAITTHPAIVEAVLAHLIEGEASSIQIGDSPAIERPGFTGSKSGIRQVADKMGAEWVDFTRRRATIEAGGSKIAVVRELLEADIVISLPKLKNHELLYFTGAIKNSMGFIPGFHKAKQHALYRSRERFARFLVDLAEVIAPHFFIIDGIVSMEGPGPANGVPVKTGILAGSVNPLALDIIASSVAGYRPEDIPTTAEGLRRQLWLSSINEIEYDGPPAESIVKSDFRRIAIGGNRNISIQFIMNRIKPLRRFDKRPVISRSLCISCGDCIRICPVDALRYDSRSAGRVRLKDSSCIRCYCCSEVCPAGAITIRRKLFGD